MGKRIRALELGPKSKPAGVGLGVFLLVAALRGQEAPLNVFRGETSVVLTDVVVLDKDRRPVRGLTASDFVVLEDGRRRPIVAVSPVEIVESAKESSASGSVSGVSSTASPSSPISNQRESTGRLAVIMFDRSIPNESATLTAKRIARQVISELGPADMAAVVRSTGFGTEGREQTFTNDRTRLLAAVDAPFVGLANPPQMAPGGLSRPPQANLLSTGDCFCGLCVLDRIARVAESLATERTRHRAIFWIGSAIVLQDDRPGMSIRCPALKEYRERAMRVLSTSNVAFHAIDPSGLESLGLMADAFPGDAPRTGATNLARQSDISVLPAYTGGRTVVNTNHPEDAIPQIFRESGSYYLLGFAPEDPTKLTRRRRIEVRVNRAGVEVRVRAGVYAPPPLSSAAASVEQLVAGLLPVSALPMKMWLVPAYDETGTAYVTARVVASPLRTLDSGGATANLLAVAVDGRGKVVSMARQQLAVSATKDIEGMVRLPVAAGDYQVRVGVQIPGANVGGSIFGEVTVPRR